MLESGQSLIYQFVGALGIPAAPFRESPPWEMVAIIDTPNSLICKACKMPNSTQRMKDLLYLAVRKSVVGCTGSGESTPRSDIMCLLRITPKKRNLHLPKTCVPDGHRLLVRNFARRHRTSADDPFTVRHADLALVPPASRPYP